MFNASTSHVVRSFMGEGPEMDALTQAQASLGAIHRANALVGHSPLIDVINNASHFQKTTALHTAENVGEGPVQDKLRAY